MRDPAYPCPPMRGGAAPPAQPCLDLFCSGRFYAARFGSGCRGVYRVTALDAAVSFRLREGGRQ